MSISRVLVVSALTLSFTAGLAAQDKKPAIEQGAVEVRLSDGGRMRMTIADPHIEFTTAHGKLKILTADIRRLEIGARLTDDEQAKLKKALADIAGNDARARSQAADDLFALREKAYPGLAPLAQNTDRDLAKRAEDVLKKIREKVPAEKLRLAGKDVVHTGNSVIAGRIELGAFTASTKQFGSVKLALSNVSSISFLASGMEIEVKLDGKYAISVENWLDTNCDMSEGSRITITASGEIDMYAQDGYQGQYVGTPKGRKAWPGNTGLPYEPGTLLGKIGRNGKVFVVGERFEDAAPGSGRLYLRAAGNPYNVATSGSYNIRIDGGITGDGREEGGTGAGPGGGGAPGFRGVKRAMAIAPGIIGD